MANIVLMHARLRRHNASCVSKRMPREARLLWVSMWAHSLLLELIVNNVHIMNNVRTHFIIMDNGSFGVGLLITSQEKTFSKFVVKDVQSIILINYNKEWKNAQACNCIHNFCIFSETFNPWPSNKCGCFLQSIINGDFRYRSFSYREFKAVPNSLPEHDS